MKSREWEEDVLRGVQGHEWWHAHVASRSPHFWIHGGASYMPWWWRLRSFSTAPSPTLSSHLASYGYSDQHLTGRGPQACEGGLGVAAFTREACLWYLFLGCTKPLSLSATPASGMAASGCGGSARPGCSATSANEGCCMTWPTIGTRGHGLPLEVTGLPLIGTGVAPSSTLHRAAASEGGVTTGRCLPHLNKGGSGSLTWR